MILNIFKKINQVDFERVEVDVIRFHENSIDIRHNNDLVSLCWDEEYSFQQLKHSDIILVFIIGDDFHHGYILPIAAHLKMDNLDGYMIMKSKLDKLNEENKKKIDTLHDILKAVSEFYQLRSSDDIDFIFELIQSADNDETVFPRIKDIIAERKILGAKNLK